MKIFQINSVCGVRSTGRIVADIYTRLRAAGHDCIMAYGRDESANCGGDAFKFNTRAGVYADALLSRITGKAGCFSTHATKHLLSEIDRYNPDVVHLHNLHGYYVNAFMLVSELARRKKPVVWTLHDCWPFTGHCAYFDKYGCDKWKSLCRDCPAKHDYPKSLFFDASKEQYEKNREIFTLPDNMTIVTPSKWLKNLVKQSFLSRYDVVVINNGVNGDAFSIKARYTALPEYLNGSEYVLGVALPFGERKGFSDFMRLRKELTDKYRIVMVGLSDKQIAALPPGITGIRRTNDVHALAALYANARCFVNLTQEDNFPTTNIESLMCGTPVVTYDTGGSPESVFAGAGEAVKKGDVTRVARILENICPGDADRQKIALEAAHRFGTDAMADKYVALYEEIAGRAVKAEICGGKQ